MQVSITSSGRRLLPQQRQCLARRHAPTRAPHCSSAGATLQQHQAANPAGLPTLEQAGSSASSSSSSGSSEGNSLGGQLVAQPPRNSAAPIAAAAVAPHAAVFAGAQARTRSSQVLAPGSIVTAALMNKLVGTQAHTEGDSYTTVDRVAYQGVPGAYSESAALKACPGWEPLPCEQFEVAFQALSQWMAERAVLPVENSLGGSIHAVYDLLLRYRLHIVGEVSVSVNHCLMALPATKKADLRRVMSHPQALAQVDGYLRRMPGVVREAVDDTAGAAKQIAEQQLEGVGAVASRRAAELYGLEILEEGIQVSRVKDMTDNITRFVVLSRDPLVSTVPSAGGQRWKTSIVFSLQEGPGQLFKAMSVFALRDINMTKIESRPMRSKPIVVSAETANGSGTRAFNYLFYIDFSGSLADPQCQNALRHLQEIAPFLRVLGSYPADTEL
ncbi:hypothetical protein N2152v2_002063 [Parachlorella kessleri]